MFMQQEHLSKRSRSTKEDKQLLQSIALFIVMAVFVAFMLVVKF